jgi:hypothetical protein
VCVAVRPREGDIVWRNGGGIWSAIVGIWIVGIWIVGTNEAVMVPGGDATTWGGASMRG